MPDLNELFGAQRLMVILRGMPPAETVTAARLAWDLGIELLEVPIGQPEQLKSLTAAVNVGEERGKHVGAGTVITADQVHAAQQAGARYTVAPGLDTDVLAASLNAHLPHLPGAATASEVQHAYAAGCRWVKVFPAATLGPGWFRALNGPFPTMRYVATGGINARTAPEYLDAGAHIVALGTALTDPEQRATFIDLINRYRSEPQQLPN